jgi:hypothetical protein
MAIRPIELQEPIILDWSQWTDQYKPIKNHFSNDPDYEMFETYGEELEFVMAQDPRNIWTYMDADGGSLIVEGYHLVNRLGYYITEKPWSENEAGYEVDFTEWSGEED